MCRKATGWRWDDGGATRSRAARRWWRRGARRDGRGDPEGEPKTDAAASPATPRRRSVASPSLGPNAFVGLRPTLSSSE